MNVIPELMRIWGPHSEKSLLFLKESIHSIPIFFDRKKGVFGEKMVFSLSFSAPLRNRQFFLLSFLFFSWKCLALRHVDSHVCSEGKWGGPPSSDTPALIIPSLPRFDPMLGGAEEGMGFHKLYHILKYQNRLLGGENCMKKL